MGTISKDFSYKEFEVTDRPGFKFKNMISDIETRDSVKALVDKVLQPLRDGWGKPLYINSGYRCRELNKAVRGVETSQNLKGEAADVCPYENRNKTGKMETILDLAQLAIDLELPFDQMILYPDFVHFNHKQNGKQRGQVLYSKNYKGEKVKICY